MRNLSLIHICLCRQGQLLLLEQGLLLLPVGRQQAVSYTHLDVYKRQLEDCADQMAERMQEIFDETTDCVIKLMKDVHETFRVRKQEAAEDLSLIHI